MQIGLSGIFLSLRHGYAVPPADGGGPPLSAFADISPTLWGNLPFDKGGIVNRPYEVCAVLRIP